MSPREAAKLGFDATFAKPLRRATVVDGLRALMDRSQAAGPEAAPQDDAMPATEDGKTRILLVEDNAVNQLFVNVILTRSGYRVDVASSGIEAIEMFRKLPYDVVLMDVQMPELDGLEATRRIRDQFPGRTTPIIALTANAMKGDRERCLDAGMDDYLTKPIDRAKLLDKIRHWREAGGAAGFGFDRPPRRAVGEAR